MDIFLSNGEIVQGEQPALCGNGVTGVFLSMCDIDVFNTSPYFKNVVKPRLIDIDEVLMRQCLLDASRKYQSQHQQRNVQL